MLAAVYFDGHTARKYPVSLCLTDGDIRVEGEGFAHAEPFHSAMLSERLGNAPRQLHLSTGGYVLIQDNAGFEAMLRQSGQAPASAVSRLESRWAYAFGALVATAFFCVGFYIWGLPLVADAVAKHIPAELAAQMDRQTLKLLDKGMLAPSRLSGTQQNAIADRLKQLVPPSGLEKPQYQLIFRSSEMIGPNAFALPGGTILVTDQLVKLAERPPSDENQVLGVLAHELGHIHHKHAMRQLIQGSVVALAMTWLLGDVSSVLAAVPTLMLQTKYTRAFEHEADEYALRAMKQNHLPPGSLADMLMKLEATHGLKQGKHEGAQHELEGYFSTHPLTQDRIRKLQATDEN